MTEFTIYLFLFSNEIFLFLKDLFRLFRCSHVTSDLRVTLYIVCY